MSAINEYDFSETYNYKGFDLSDFDRGELPVIVEKIEEIHESLQCVRDLCEVVLKAVPSEGGGAAVLDAVARYGQRSGGRTKEFADLIAKALEHDPDPVRLAKAKAFRIAYARQFEDEESEPLHPYEFERSDVFRSLQRLVGKRNPFPSLLELN